MDSPLELADIIDEGIPAEEVTPDPAKMGVDVIAEKFAEFQIEREKKFLEFTLADPVGILGVEAPKSDDGNSETPEEVNGIAVSDMNDDDEWNSFENLLKDEWYARRG